MADDKDLLSRADSLIKPEAATTNERRESTRQIRRRRSFLASSTSSDSADGAARFARRASEDDDPPLLTEVVVAEEPEQEASVESIAASLRPGLATDLSALIDQYLAAELPAMVEATLLDATDHLRHAVEATIATALRDFVGQRGQLRLPLEDADRSEPAAAHQE